ncbi:phytanoyl-CoA dioxygenase family protein [Phenylobacterium sp.]|uniref:phytanoyl-CoA dioxygenase family protein n=1 Tax=Phenylobacterium sp. TaxID=1871053 RepID=UPI0025E0B7F3|nr:phytanoyl-CoA dioxygenase family protein [Phenylobacterium sp.]MCA6285875.1 phytanoyl-CoA dioxygenase family protein [Phenylobacterium sp.]MCA6288121.1 phytanoyl-CoA dioxygenase family protein [Phenylobacterium sp.]MCA6311669.1 phytanoyl-CoA dioxygenase family protein [Phenylobacterium sp.]MCA6324693.1 phytanoyl-CoA dioxygenase family protein [Phenylobacterium sp.]MCA6338492.1 phytanoyl-CoA dioxygenase family protein [Phenylobacterium sp.]
MRWDTTVPDCDKFLVDGYQVFENIVPMKVIQEVRSFLSDKINETLEPAKREIGSALDSDVVQVIGDIAAGRRGGVGSLSKSTRDALSGHFSLEARLSQILWKVPYSEKFQSILRTLLASDDLYMHMPPTARYVLPGNIHAGVPPHQDISYNKHMSNFVTIWVPFVDIDESCGGVTVYEGSGQAPEYSVEQPSSDFWLQGVPTEGYMPVHCTMKAGSVLALNKWVIHGSAANRSSDIRISTDFRFFGAADRSTKHYLDMKRRHVIQPEQETL